jgi:hypothetical protein
MSNMSLMKLKFVSYPWCLFTIYFDVAMCMTILIYSIVPWTIIYNMTDATSVTWKSVLQCPICTETFTKPKYLIWLFPQVIIIRMGPIDIEVLVWCPMRIMLPLLLFPRRHSFCEHCLHTTNITWLTTKAPLGDGLIGWLIALNDVSCHLDQ